MTEVDRLRVVYEVQDQQFHAGMKRMQASGQATSRVLVQQAESVETAFRDMQGNVGGIAAQFNDIGVTAAAGMNPLLIALQQGTQLSQTFAGQGLAQTIKGVGSAFAAMVSPVSLATIGLTAVAAVAVQAALSLFSSGEAAEELGDKVESLQSAVADYQSAVDNASMSTSQLAEKYGIAARQAQELLTIIANMARIEAATKLREGIEAISGSFDGLITRVQQYNEMAGSDLGALDTGFATAKARLEDLTDEFGLSIEQAQELAALLQNQQTAASVDEQAQAVREIATWLAAAAEEAGYSNDALNEVAHAAANSAASALELEQTTREAAYAADDLSASVGSISFAGAISGADALAGRIAGMIGQARALMSALGQAAARNASASDRRALLETEQKMLEAGESRVKIEGELAVLSEKQKLASAGINNPVFRNTVAEQAREDAEAIERSTAAISDLTAARAKAEKAASGGGGGGGRKRSGGGGSKRTARAERPFFENVEKDLLNLQRQIELIGKNSEEVATLKAQWELLDEAKKRGVQVDAVLSEQIGAQAAAVGRLTKQLEDAEIARSEFEDGVGSIVDSFADAIAAGDDFFDSLKKSLIDAGLQSALDALKSSLTNLFTGMGGGGSGFFGGLVSNLFGGRSFDGGGFTGAGARSGGIDGKGGFPAILHPNETVVDHTRGQRAGGNRSVSLTIDLRGTTGDRELDAKIAAAGKSILAQVPAVMDNVTMRQR